MNLLLYKTLAGLLIFLVAFVMALPALLKKQKPAHSERVELGDAFASGIFLGAALLHLLPDAVQAFASAPGLRTYPFAELICAAGFLLLLFLERLSLSWSVLQTRQSIPYVIALTLMTHAFIEGAALGISPTFAETSLLLIAIVAHKGSESFALCNLLLRHRLALKTIVVLTLVFTLMTPLGIVLGSWLAVGHSNGMTIGTFDAFAAGTFLYISTLHHGHFHEHASGKQGLLEYAALLTGTAFMGVIALWT